jgi:streptomycin 3"-adenylyltransferase
MLPEKLLNEIVAGYREILGGLLIGFYVHGSIAFGCYNTKFSDIDFLVVVRETPMLEMKKSMISLLLKLDCDAPAKGFEMSVVLESFCREFVYPTPFELHYSNFHRERALADLSSYCAVMNGADRDLAAHFTVIKAVGIRLWGCDISNLFGEVKKEYYLDSIRGDISGAVEEITENTVYIILNLCRVLAYTRDGLICSKRDGGEWGIRKLPRYAKLISTALDCYRGSGMIEADADWLREFARFMLGEIL